MAFASRPVVPPPLARSWSNRPRMVLPNLREIKSRRDTYIGKILIPIGIEPDSRKVKASSSFLRKRTKKLLLIGVRVGSNGRLKLQKFLLLFSKKGAFLLAKGQPQRRLVLYFNQMVEQLHTYIVKTLRKLPAAKFLLSFVAGYPWHSLSRHRQ